METMNVTFDELSAKDFEQRSLKTELQEMNFGHISSGIDLTYASSSQKPTECVLDLLFEAMYDNYIGVQLLDALRTTHFVLANQLLQTPNASTTTADSALTTTNSSSQAPTTPNTSQDVDKLQPQPQQVQHQGNDAYLRSKTIPDNVQNAMFDGNTFVNPFTKDHPLEQVIGEPSRPVSKRNQLWTYDKMCIYALSVSTIEPSNVKEAMTDPGWIDSMQDGLLQFKRLDNHFIKGTVDPTLFIRRFKDDILVLQVHEDDIIFSSTNP
nr:Gag-Pol polyprotein [Tanacetum cinerariifolium]